MRLGLLAASLLLASLLTGCIGDGGDDLDPTGTLSPEDVVDARAALDAGENAANVELLSSFRDGFGQEAHPWGDYLFVDQGGSVAILDVADPARVEKVGEIALPAVVDVKTSADGEWLFAVEDAELSGENPLAGTGPFVGGLYAVDIADKANPTLVAYTPIGTGRGPHMVFYHTMPNGDELLFHAAGESVIITSFDRATGTAEELARYTPGLLAQNTDPRVIDPYYGVRGWVHDMFVETTEDGRVLMSVAAWDAGLHIVDVSDPAAPAFLGSWNDFQGEEQEGNLHTVVTAQIGERRITVGSVEVGFLIVGGYHWAMGTDKSLLFIWDTTDPSAPELVGTWVNPVKPYTGRNAYLAGPLPGERIESSHNIQVENGRIYLAHYELGTWVLDISTPEKQASPEIVGYFFDEEEGEVWDVVLNDGALYTSGDAGIVGLHFVLDALGPTGVTSRA